MASWTLFSGNTHMVLPQAPDHIPEDGFLWLDACLDEELGWLPGLEHLLGQPLDELHVDDLVNPLHPSHFDSGEGYSRLIFRSLSTRPLFDEGHRLSVKTRPTYFLMFDRILVSYRSRESRTFKRAEAYLQSNEDPPIEHFLSFKKRPEAPDELLTQLVSNLIDRFLEVRIELSDRLDRWQRDLLSPRKKFEDWSALLAARAELNKLESMAEDHYDALQDWEEDLVKTGGARKVVLVNLSDAKEHVKRVIKLADRLGANTEAAVQLHFSATAHKTNEIITVLTMLSAVFMPLTLITGLFGMNFERMPWLQEPWGFWACMGLMGLSTAISVGVIIKIRAKPNTLGSVKV